MLVALLLVGCGLIAGKFHHTFGIAPVLGAILCAACFLRPRDVFLVGIGGILVRDLLADWGPFTLVRVAAITLVVVAIVLLRVRPVLRSLAMGLLVCSPIFHLTLAIGDWWTGYCSILPKTPQGLLQSIATALPYFQRAFLVDLIFTGVFLALYGLAASLLLRRQLSLGRAHPDEA